MSSIKCKKCGLVNFAQASECKRCLYQFDNKRAQPAQFQNFQMPPPPPNFSANEAAVHNSEAYSKPPCVKCGSSQNTAIYNFKKKYVPPVALLGFFFGILPWLLLRLLLSTTHFLTAPFCQKCWSSFKKADALAVLNVFAFFIIAIGGIIFAISNDSEGLLFASILGAIAFYFAGLFYIGKISPKFKKVNSQQVIIDAPLVGEILYTK